MIDAGLDEVWGELIGADNDQIWDRVRASLDAGKRMAMALESMEEIGETVARLQQERVDADRAPAVQQAQMEVEKEIEERGGTERENARLKAELASVRRSLANKNRALTRDGLAPEPPVPDLGVPTTIAADPQPPPRPKPPSGLRWVTSLAGGKVLAVGEPVTEGERVAFEVLAKLGGLLIQNCNVYSRRREREVDAIAILPQGIFTFEVKDTRHSGVLEVPVNGPARVAGRPLDNGEGRRQARQQSQVLHSIAKSLEIDIGFVQAVLVFHGDVQPKEAVSGTILVTTTSNVLEHVKEAALAGKTPSEVTPSKN